MQNEDTISVIIPNYNRANDLVKAVKSALNQTVDVLEVLVCDDGSTDNSKELVTAINDPKVKWIDCGKNGGPAIPRNIGIERSSGNWVAFLDSDDEWLPSKIEKQLAALKQFNTKAACSNAFRIRLGENKGLFLKFPQSTVKLFDLFQQNEIICSSTLIHKQLLLETSLFPVDKKFIAIEDYALWLRLATKTEFAFVNEGLVNYTDNVETSIRTNYSDTWVIYDIIFSDFREWLNSRHIKLDHEVKKEFRKLRKKIKQKGIPTAMDEFFRKLSDKLGIKTKYNS